MSVCIAISLGSTNLQIHGGPKIFTSSLKLLRQDSLIAKTESLIHEMQMLDSLSLKNCSPSCLANTGNVSITVSLTLQFLSLLSSYRAGTMLCDRFSIPMTLLRSSSLLNKPSLTSGLSSLKRDKKIGMIWSLVAYFPMRGHTARTLEASPFLTYWKVSVESFLKQGTIFYTIVCASKIDPNSATLVTAAVLTSDSLSARKPQ